MVKQSLLIVTSLLIGISAFAQNEMQRSSMKASSEDYSRADYIARGVILGPAYDHLDVELKIKLRDKTTGIDYSSSAKSDSATDLAGLKVGYASMPKEGVGLNMGLTGLKVNRSSMEGKTYYNYRGEGNLTIATPLSNMLALYGFGGANLDYLTDSGEIEPLGFGLQAGAGLAIGSNVSLEAGYTVAMHQWKDSVVDGSPNAELEKSDSYILLKGLSVRATYNF